MGDSIMFTSPIAVYTTDMIYSSILAGERSAIDAAKESQWQRFLFRKWCRKLGEQAQPRPY